MNSAVGRSVLGLAGALSVLLSFGSLGRAETVTIKGTGKAFKYDGASGSISYSVTGGAPKARVVVSASTSETWIHVDLASQDQSVLLNAKGTGKGSVKYQVDVYSRSTPSPRLGTIQIADKRFEACQTGVACAAVRLDPTASQYSAAGDNGLFAVCAPSGCGWSGAVDNTAPQIELADHSSGGGDGSIAFTALENAQAKSRAGKISVTPVALRPSVKTHPVKQAAYTGVAPEVAAIDS